MSLTCNYVELTCRNPDWQCWEARIVFQPPIWQGLCWLVDGPTEATEVIWHLFSLDFTVLVDAILRSLRKMKIHQPTTAFFLRLGMSLLSSLIFSQILLPSRSTPNRLISCWNSGLLSSQDLKVQLIQSWESIMFRHNPSSCGPKQAWFIPSR